MAEPWVPRVGDVAYYYRVGGDEGTAQILRIADWWVRVTWNRAYPLSDFADYDATDGISGVYCDHHTLYRSLRDMIASREYRKHRVLSAVRGLDAVDDAEQIEAVGRLLGAGDAPWVTEALLKEVGDV